MMCDAAVPAIPLYSYKLNWPITCDLPESGTFLSGAFLFLSGIVKNKYHLTYVVDTLKNPLKETILLSPLSICCRHSKEPS